MARLFLQLLSILAPFLLSAQLSLSDFRQLDESRETPVNLTSSRTAVFVESGLVQSAFTLEGDWKKISNQAHNYLHKMGVDAILYVNYRDFYSGNSTKHFYNDQLKKRSVEHILILTQTSSGFNLICTKYNGQSTLVNNKQTAYKLSSNSLDRLMLTFARDVKKADRPLENFLIPEKPYFLDVLPIVENSNLKNYPGQIRRSKLAVEKFSPLPIPEDANADLKEKIDRFNQDVEAKNIELTKVLSDYPYDIEFVNYMSDEDLLRNRYQFILRNLSTTGESIRAQLKYQIQPSKAGYVSVIPINDESTSIKTIPKHAIVSKFYIRQNIAKNVYVGEWDADATWQDALKNYLGNMFQYFRKGN